MTVSELRDISWKSRLTRHSALRKADLIRFLMRRSSEKTDAINEKIFPDALKTWVSLFVSDKSVAEHYYKIISDTITRPR